MKQGSTTHPLARTAPHAPRNDRHGRPETAPVAFGRDTPLLGILTIPAGRTSSRGVVVCPSFGHQNICSYRPLRTLAVRAAEHGLPVLRFDWPGCGDSGDLPLDGAGLASWLASVEDACQLLVEEAGLEQVSLVGLRIGATVGLLAAAANPLVSDVVLLAPHVTGRAYLRELRAFEVLAEQTFFAEPESPPPPLPHGSMEAGGFLLTPAEVRALESIDLAAAELTHAPARTLIVSFQDDASTKSLAPRLADAGSHVTMRVLPELAHVWDSSQLSFMPASCSRLVVDWLAETADEDESASSFPRGPATLELEDGAIREEAIVLEGQRGRLFAVTCTGRDTDVEAGDWVVFLNTGRIRRVGTNRLSTVWARRWARHGVPSLRLDVLGVGDSDGDTMGDEEYVDEVARAYRKEILRDIGDAIDWLAAEHGARRVALVGLCSGATLAFETALTDERVAGVGMVNPPAFVWDDDLLLVKAWEEAHAAAKDPLVLLRVARSRGRRWVQRALRGRATRLDSDAVVDALERLRAAGTRVTTVYSDRDLGLRYLERTLGPNYAWQLASLGVGFEVIAGPDHTFRPLWSHDLVQDRLERLLASIGYLDVEGPS